MTITQRLSLAFLCEQTADIDLPVGFGHAQWMSYLKARYVEITHSQQISIFQSSNNWTCPVQTIVSAAVLKLGSFNAERINHKYTQSSCHHQNTGSAIPHRNKRVRPIV